MKLFPKKKPPRSFQKKQQNKLLNNKICGAVYSVPLFYLLKFYHIKKLYVTINENQALC